MGRLSVPCGLGGGAGAGHLHHLILVCHGIGEVGVVSPELESLDVSPGLVLPARLTTLVGAIALCHGAGATRWAEARAGR